MGKIIAYSTGVTSITATVDEAWYNKYYDSEMDDFVDLMEESDLFELALEDVTASKIETEDNDLKVTIKELAELQKEAKEHPELNLSIGVVEDYLTFGGTDCYELRINGEVYSNYISADTAENIIKAITFGFEVGSRRAEVAVETTAGSIRAYKSTDPGQPGISVMFQPKGYNCEVDAAYVSVYEDKAYVTKDNEKGTDLVIMAYGDISTEDYTSKDIIRREDVEVSLSDSKITA